MRHCSRCGVFLYPEELENIIDTYYYCEVCYPIAKYFGYDPNEYEGYYYDDEDGMVIYY